MDFILSCWCRTKRYHHVISQESETPLYGLCLILLSGFYLGYLRGRSFPRKMPSFPPKILLSLQYISNYIGKIIQRDEVSAHYFLKIGSQNAPDCISVHIHFKQFPGGACPPTPLGSSWPSATRDFSPKR